MSRYLMWAIKNLIKSNEYHIYKSNYDDKIKSKIRKNYCKYFKKA